MFSKTFGLAAAFATLASALPSGMIMHRSNGTGTSTSGGVTITNNLNVDIYAWSVVEETGSMQTLTANGGTYQENWKTNPNGGGVSIKLSTTQELVDVLQFEYTESSDTNTIYWDLSCVDMAANEAFTKYGFSVIPSNDGNNASSCPSAICKAGDSACSAAYIKPYDDWATHGCPIDTGLALAIGQ
ncbi:Secreted thaumatin-like protein cetA [Penicillium taxi]|uniref:Secreted thaumatin-like protein cetA n=1 Tax=Penicillium taxi TaxID=168475 RepID=UPI0025457017|nr:Secreted thaumatin-like protein cetA [Penicillium taxi]KAJ5888499.1 Secreted thaumatin-like protein cetA [Penicillium taxi]